MFFAFCGAINFIFILLSVLKFLMAGHINFRVNGLLIRNDNKYLFKFIKARKFSKKEI